MPAGKSMKWKDENRENSLLQNDELYQAALDEFSRKSFHEASLNDILKAVKMNKGSFYYRFYDKLDLYLSLFHRVGLEKLAFFRENFPAQPVAEGFFGQIRVTARLGLLFARKEKRYYDFWRNYLGEDNFIQATIKDNFTHMADDTLDEFIQAAKNRGELDGSYSNGFINTVIKLLLYNIDRMIAPEMSEEEILQRIDELMRFMKNGLVV